MIPSALRRVGLWATTSLHQSLHVQLLHSLARLSLTSSRLAPEKSLPYLTISSISSRTRSCLCQWFLASFATLRLIPAFSQWHQLSRRLRLGSAVPVSQGDCMHLNVVSWFRPSVYISGSSSLYVLRTRQVSVLFVKLLARTLLPCCHRFGLESNCAWDFLVGLRYVDITYHFEFPCLLVLWRLLLRRNYHIRLMS